MTTTLDSAEGIALLERVIAAIQLEIKKHKGAVTIRTKVMQPSFRDNMLSCAGSWFLCVRAHACLQPIVTSHQDVFAEGDGDDDAEDAEIDAADI